MPARVCRQDVGVPPIMLERLKIRVYDVLVETEDGELVDRIVAVFLMLLILLNAAAVVAETVDDLNQRFGSIFSAIEMVALRFFPNGDC